MEEQDVLAGVHVLRSTRRLDISRLFLDIRYRRMRRDLDDGEPACRRDLNPPGQ